MTSKGIRDSVGGAAAVGRMEHNIKDRTGVRVLVHGRYAASVIRNDGGNRTAAPGKAVPSAIQVIGCVIGPACHIDITDIRI